MQLGLGLSLGMVRRVGGAPVATVQLSGSSVAEDASVGDLVGTLSVANGSGDYTFTLTDDAGGLFALDGTDDTLLEVAGALDYETATSHSITVSADNGVDPAIQRTFSITVTDVSEGGGVVALFDSSLITFDSTAYTFDEAA